MPFGLSIDPAIWSGAGSAVLGLVTGSVAARRGKVAKLEAEVAECRRRDADYRIVTAGVRLMAGEIKRELPDSKVLAMVSDLLDRRLGPPPSVDDLADLITELDEKTREEGHDE